MGKRKTHTQLSLEDLEKVRPRWLKALLLARTACSAEDLKSEVRTQYQRLMRLAFPEKTREYNQRYAEKHPLTPEIKAARRPGILAAKKRHYENNKDEHAAAVFEWRSKNRPKYRETCRRHRRNNPELYKQYDQSRRALKRNATTEDCTGALKKLSQETACYWCSGELTDENREIDHIRPLSRDGSHSPDNLVASCRKCNRSKNNKLYWEWDGELAA